MTKNELHGKLIKEFIDRYRETGDKKFLGQSDMILKLLVDAIVKSVLEDVKVNISNVGGCAEWVEVEAVLKDDNKVNLGYYLTRNKK